MKADKIENNKKILRDIFEAKQELSKLRPKLFKAGDFQTKMKLNARCLYLANLITELTLQIEVEIGYK